MIFSRLKTHPKTAQRKTDFFKKMQTRSRISKVGQKLQQIFQHFGKHTTIFHADQPRAWPASLAAQQRSVGSTGGARTPWEALCAGLRTRAHLCRGEERQGHGSGKGCARGKGDMARGGQRCQGWGTRQRRSTGPRRQANGQRAREERTPLSAGARGTPGAEGDGQNRRGTGARRVKEAWRQSGGTATGAEKGVQQIQGHEARTGTGEAQSRRRAGGTRPGSL